MTPTCTHCGSDEATWLEIIGNVVDPRGSRYKCDDCGYKFNDVDQPNDTTGWCQ